VLFIDLDEFKAVNDTHGHGMGDRVLVVVADRLRASLRPADIAARLGGDEFAVLVDHAPDQKQLDAMARRILQALREPMTVEGVAMSVPGTIGMALAEGDTDTCDELLRRADVAMYAAKREGKDRVGVYRALAA
jgi:diguanylate cyclase (GGDEF)-like protein